MKIKPYKVFFFFIFMTLFMLKFNTETILATSFSIPQVTTTDNPEEVVSSLQLLLLLASIVFAPALLLMVTSFTRIIVTLHFVRSALGTQQMPPNQILIGLALFLTLFLMASPLEEINQEALQPYLEGEITQEEALSRGAVPIKKFMTDQVEIGDLNLFSDLSGQEYTKDDIPFTVLAPAFIIGELKKGFEIGFMIYIPFIVIDMVVASTLMAMGMMMLPPAMISLPFKILLFIAVDGWNLIMRQLSLSFNFF